MDTWLVQSFTCAVAGPIGCCKTKFVTRLLGHSSTLINLPPEKMTWCYGEWQPLNYTSSATHAKIDFVEGLLTCRPSTPKRGTWW